MKRYKVTLIPITAIHIGTGNELDLFSYTVKNGFFYRFSIEKLLNNINNEKRKSLNEFIDKADFKELAKIFHEYVDDRSILYKIPVTKSFEEKFKSKLEDPNNQLLVYEMYRSLDDYSPVIPGSSIKGAIRTAIINELSKSVEYEKLYESGRIKNDFEKIILKYYDAKNDPFRAIHITDCKIKGNNTQIVGEIVNYKPNRKRGKVISKMQLIIEQIRGTGMGGDTIGEFEVYIDDILQNIKIENFHINIKISLENLLKSCNSFYPGHFQKEIEKFYKNPKEKELEEIFNRMKNKILKNIINIRSDNNECFIRLGRFSHFENVTIDYKGKKEYTSRFLTEDGLFPLGLAKLKFEEIRA